MTASLYRVGILKIYFFLLLLSFFDFRQYLFIFVLKKNLLSIETMATNTELDPVFRQALRLMHSSSSDAAENIRKSLDDIIKQRHGPSKMLINTLSKKHLAEESLATGSGVIKPAPTIRRQSHKSSDSSSNNSNSSPIQLSTAVTVASGQVATTSGGTSATVLTTDLSGQQQEIPVIISLSDSSGNATITAVDDNAIDDNIMLDNQHLKDLEDLVCVVCRRIDTSAINRLIECTKCNLLYHQECHTPQISDLELLNDQELSWYCDVCKKKSIKPTPISVSASPAKSYSSHSSSSSSSSSSSICIVPIAAAPATTIISSVSTPAVPLNVASAPSISSGSSSSSRRDKEHSSSTTSKSKSSSSSSRHHHHHHHHHSSSSSAKHERTGSGSNGSSSKSSITPNINIISADKRLQNMKKKAAKSHESKRKK